MRNDCHKPSALESADYVYVASKCKVEGLGDALCNAEDMKKLHQHMASTGGTWAKSESGGSCHVCGSVHLIYPLFFWHQPSNTYIRMGKDCAEFLDRGGHEFFVEKAKNALLRDKGKAKAKAILGTIEGVDHEFAWSIYEKASQACYREKAVKSIVESMVNEASSLRSRRSTFLNCCGS